MKDTTYYTHYKGEYIQVLPVEECVKSILSRIESYEDTIKRLKEENKKLSEINTLMIQKTFDSYYIIVDDITIRKEQERKAIKTKF